MGAPKLVSKSKARDVRLRQIIIDGKKIVVIDGLFDPVDISETYQILRKTKYVWRMVESKAIKHTIRWGHDFSGRELSDLGIVDTIVDQVNSYFDTTELLPYRVYANFSTHGEMFYGHVDSGPGGLTAIYYANMEWDRAWHGETVFYNSQGEPLHVVAPKPGRLVIFHGDIPHRASSPSRECYEPRLNIAFKFLPSREMSRVAKEEKKAKKSAKVLILPVVKRK
jgi:SM-20-related protein